jgi:hypothetical protein
MNRTVHKFCAWSGVCLLIIMGIGFVLLAGYIPTRSPSQSAAETAQFLLENRDRIRWGMILTMFSAALLQPFYTEIALQMRRIEGRYPALALIQFGLGTLLVLEFIYLIFFWQTAVYRVDRAPELVQLLNDMAWIPFVGLSSTVVLGVAVFGIAILLDRRPQPVFPRWLGYFNLWAALMFTPGTFNVFFQDGPLAWNGIVAWYLPVAVFAIWLIVISIYLSKAVDSMGEDELGGATGVSNGSASVEVTRLRAKVDQLQSDVDRLLSRAGRS